MNFYRFSKHKYGPIHNVTLFFQCPQPRVQISVRCRRMRARQPIAVDRRTSCDRWQGTDPDEGIPEVERRGGQGERYC